MERGLRGIEIRRMYFVLVSLFLILILAGTSNATLTQIGTAGYGSGQYKLIYDDVNAITWLDYSYRTAQTLAYDQANTWVASLNAASTLNYSILTGYNIDSWASNDWRLPVGNNQVGDYITSTELGYLYYTDLGNIPDDTTLNFGLYDQLLAANYWSDYYVVSGGVGYSQVLRMDASAYRGYQHLFTENTNGGTYAIAVISGDVTYSPQAVPEPATILLFGTGILGFAGARIRRKNK